METTSATLPITDRVKTYEDACAVNGTTPITIDHFSFLPENQRARAFADHQIVTIIEALNEGWVPDWDNNSERKYFPWWDTEAYGDAIPGSGFSFRDDDCAGSSTGVGARLCTKSAELCRYAATQFIDIYRVLIK